MSPENADRILVVDDEESIRAVLTEVLTDDGFSVTQAANGLEAWAVLQDVSHPLVITDIKMPEMSGIELLKKIRQTVPDTEVIIITSYASLDTAITALRYGAYDYLFKPFEDIKLISAAASRAIEKVRLLRQNQRLLRILKQKNIQLKKVNKTLKWLARRDGLTGLYNHRYFQEILSAEFTRAVCYNQYFSVAFLDLDHFKHYNDTNGHQQGDQLLRTLAKILKSCLRETDFLARYGGEEFTIILPSTTRGEALAVAEKIRGRVERYPFKGRETQPNGCVTISVGISTFPDDGKDNASLMETADQALYEAKESGRNQVCSFSASKTHE
jgi:diguanylate cyclase (GGDEF)-like protein